MGWGSFLKATLRLGGSATQATIGSAGKAIIHPATTIRNLGTATKTAVVGGGAAYVGWQKLTTDQSVVGIVSDAVIGEKATEKVSDTLGGVADGVNDLKDSVGHLSDNVGNAISNVDGNGGDMFGNFFSNLGHGNVSGLSLVGLVVSALLVFGRFGWLGKIAGAVLGMMMIGNNANMNQIQGSRKDTPSQLAQATPEQVQGNGGGMRR